MFVRIVLLVLAAVLSCPATHADACTGFFVKAEDGAVVYGRSLEFGIELDSKVIVVPRGTAYSGTMPNGAKGAEWATKYGFLGMNFRGYPHVVDGFNEKGLLYGTFWFPGYGQYPDYDPATADKSIASWELGAWLLGQFGSVAEVRQALGDLRIVKVVNKDLNMVPPAHYLVLDASGEAIVIEVLNGKIVVYDNPVGVLTNAPTFDWHLTNLRNYIGLSPNQIEPANLRNLKLEPLGQGAGMRGLPGDITPPSRFVRAAFYSAGLYPIKTAREAMDKVMRLHQTFYITSGMVEPPKGQDGSPEITQWQVYEDLKNHLLYFSDYQNLNIRKIDASKLDYSPGPIRELPINQPQVFEDLTNKLK